MKLPVLSGQQLVKILSKLGFKPKRQRGSHIILVREVEDSKKSIVIPNHREIDRETLIEIIRQAELTREEFLELL